MANTYISEGSRVAVTVSAGATAGDIVVLGAMCGVALSTVPAGGVTVIDRTGEHRLAKATGQAWTVGQKIYWDNTNKRCTTTATGNTFIGHATSAAAASDTTGTVVLCPGGS